MTGDISTGAVYLTLVLAAALEAGGDALMRGGLHGHTLVGRVGLFAAAALALFTYGVVVNAPPWDFGKLLGIYVTLFFVVTQVINLVFFGQRPDPPILIGGAMIIGGGLVIAFWRA